MMQKGHQALCVALALIQHDSGGRLQHLERPDCSWLAPFRHSCRTEVWVCLGTRAMRRGVLQSLMQLCCCNAEEPCETTLSPQQVNP